MILELTPAEITRFYSYLRLTGCGVGWAGSDVNNRGYGRFVIYRNGKRIRILAHRLAYKLATGEDPGDAVVRHGCDTPLCCTPDCLSSGTQADNIRDAIDRGRHNSDGLAIPRLASVAAFQERMTSGQKHCPDCTTTKPISGFNLNRSTADGHQNICRQCQRVRDKGGPGGLNEDERASERRRRQKRRAAAAQKENAA